MKQAGGFLILLILLTVITAGCLAGNGSPSHEEQAVIRTTPVPTAAVTGTLPPVATVPEKPAPPPLVVRGERRSFTFLSGGKEYSFPVDVAPVTGAGNQATCPLMSWRAGEEEQLASWYAGIFRDPAEAPLYDALLGELRRIRRVDGLNDDEYLELLTHFVQQIPYDPAAPICPRRPDQVILDGKGDCDEKSLLLLGLLDREGYDAAILIFTDQHHATAGIRITTGGQPSFRVYGLNGRKYVYIETTGPSFIGLYPDSFEDANPVIIPTGNGTITYRAINDVMHIVSTQKRMEQKLRWINETGTGMEPEIETLESKLSAGTGYSTQEEYDTDYARYSSLVAQYNNYVDQFNQIREVYLYVIQHQTDRSGVSGRIENSKVENLL
ncbi:MAG TPA: hypothetical protein VMB35_07335 [Methanomicrobiales archaeon]|nr:hypothetical protein [Methanomicrobiales archaeon]